MSDRPEKTGQGSAVPREQLEPVVVALAVIDRRFIEGFDPDVLSPGARTLLDAIRTYPHTARLNLVDLACFTECEEAARIADVARSLTLEEIVEWTPNTTLGLLERCSQVSDRIMAAAARPSRRREPMWRVHHRLATAAKQ